MKLPIINGSPRNKKSNSKLLVEQFLIGYNKISNEKVPIHYIANWKQKEDTKKVFENADIVIFIFPLYTDCMPGIVKEFFEDINALNLIFTNKIGFIVQSGFPEAEHSVYIERYLKKFSKRLNCEYLGTVIKGGVEGIQIMPQSMTKKLFTKFQDLGEYFAINNSFSLKIVEQLRSPYKMSATRRFTFNLFSKTGLTNFYWNKKLKTYNAFNKRFDKPYVEK